MKLNIKKIGIIVGALFVGALATWAIINWIPSTTILVGAIGAGYVAYIKVK